MLGVNTSQQQLYEQMILQQQHLNILKCFNPGFNANLPTNIAASINLPSTHTLENSKTDPPEQCTASTSAEDTPLNKSV